MVFQSGPWAALVYPAGRFGTPADPNIPPERKPSGKVGEVSTGYKAVRRN
jgi:hypothetical protein